MILALVEGVKINVLSSISQISKKETSKALTNFISGARTKETNWCERVVAQNDSRTKFQSNSMQQRPRIRLQFKIFADENDLFVVSIKGKIIADKEYLGLIKRCNCGAEPAQATSR